MQGLGVLGLWSGEPGWGLASPAGIAVESLTGEYVPSKVVLHIMDINMILGIYQTIGKSIIPNRLEGSS